MVTIMSLYNLRWKEGWGRTEFRMHVLVSRPFEDHCISIPPLVLWNYVLFTKTRTPMELQRELTLIKDRVKQAYGINFTLAPNSLEPTKRLTANTYVEFHSQENGKLSVCLVYKDVPNSAEFLYNELAKYCNETYPDELFIAFFDVLSSVTREKLKNYTSKLGIQRTIIL